MACLCSSFLHGPMDYFDQIGHYHCDDDWCIVCVFHYHISSSMAALVWKTTIFHSRTLATQFAQCLMLHVCLIVFCVWIAWGDIVIYETTQSGPQTMWKRPNKKHTNLQLNRWWINKINRTTKLTQPHPSHHIIKTIFLDPFQARLRWKCWPPSDWCLDLACVHADCCDPPRRPSPWSLQ